MNRGKKTFFGSTASDIFFTGKTYNNTRNNFKRVKEFTATYDNSIVTHRNFHKANVINKTSTFEVESTNHNKRLNRSIDCVALKKTLNKNGINSFNIKTNDSSVISPLYDKEKMTFNTVYINTKSPEFEKVQKELLDKGIVLKEKTDSHGFKRNDILPAKITYRDVSTYERKMPKSKSAINIKEAKHRYIITKNGYCDTNYKNITKETTPCYQTKQK